MARKLMAQVSFRVLPEQNEQFAAWAAELGMTKSNFLALAALLGAKALMRQVSPEKFITPDLMKKMQAAGFGLPEQSKDEEFPSGFSETEEYKIDGSY